MLQFSPQEYMPGSVNELSSVSCDSRACFQFLGGHAYHSVYLLTSLIVRPAVSASMPE